MRQTKADPSVSSVERLPDCLLLGVIMERRASLHPWQDHIWKVVALLTGGGPADGWRRIDGGPGWARYYAGRLPLRLFRDETEGYRYNLACEPPLLFVVLRPGDGEHELEPFLITANPYEAEDYLDSDEEGVEGVAMPPEVGVWVEAFVARHHVERPFVKRKQKSKRVGRLAEPVASKLRRRPDV